MDVEVWRLGRGAKISFRPPAEFGFRNLILWVSAVEVQGEGRMSLSSGYRNIDGKAVGRILPGQGSPAIFQFPGERAQSRFLVASMVKRRNFAARSGMPSCLCLPTPMSDGIFCFPVKYRNIFCSCRQNRDYLNCYCRNAEKNRKSVHLRLF